MPKKKREWYPGAVYHIMCRGNRRSDLFRDEEDFLVYLSILQEAEDKHDFVLYSYCLMTNHVHLHLKTKDKKISKIMRTINLLYAKYFNNKHNFIGHLFQGRYKSELIENDSYNLTISKYIHLNPVRAEMVEKPVEYEWSSYRTYMGKTESELVDKAKSGGKY